MAVGTEKPILFIQFTNEKRSAGSDALFQEPDLRSGKLYVKNGAVTRSVFFSTAALPAALSSTVNNFANNSLTALFSR
jgi:hypothetical protein